MSLTRMAHWNNGLVVVFQFFFWYLFLLSSTHHWIIFTEVIYLLKASVQESRRKLKIKRSISTVSYWSSSTFAYAEWIINWDRKHGSERYIVCPPFEKVKIYYLIEEMAIYSKIKKMSSAYWAILFFKGVSWSHFDSYNLYVYVTYISTTDLY